MPFERLWQVLVPVIPVALLVGVVPIVVIPRGLATHRAGLGVTLLLGQLIELLIVLGGGTEPDLLVVSASAGSAVGNVQVVISQLHDDLQHGLHAAAQVGCGPGADTFCPDPLLPRRRLLHLEQQ